MRDNKFMRGQIWWMEGYEVHKEGGKRRPALIVSNDTINGNMMNENITIVPLTSNIERIDIPTNVVFDRWNRSKNVIKCGEVVTIYKNQLVCYESTLDNETMVKVEEALKLTLNLEDNTSKKDKKDLNQEIAVIYSPQTSSISDTAPDITKEYVELMEYEIERAGSSIKWTPENEAVFMKLYNKFGIESVMEKFGFARNTTISMASKLRQKYPEFKSEKRVKV